MDRCQVAKTVDYAKYLPVVSQLNTPDDLLYLLLMEWEFCK